ncbi:PREDICTED: uncharacterized protein LOC109338745 [Lupinus angustifolius]|uniref:uncharacterized protein LOC109338745 n=1 Tax=Lupinus angustifolius TaxID=3871 RepID=UPI00092F6584|nr:PREDICTED: uncharacterized protein LOC109338745 [Lupinus angustifolius]
MLDIWEMEEDQFVVVDLDKDGRPIGEEATTLTRFIGSVVRRYQYAPINYKSWKEMSKEHKDEMLEILEAKFEFVPPINNETIEMLKAQLNEKWRQWKFDLKLMTFDPSKTEEQVASILPDDRVDSSQYRDLVHYWFSENGQVSHKANRLSHSMLLMILC